jgi:membrane protease YdiL (CAAX protease family)
MNRTIAYCALIVFFGVIAVMSVAAPGILSDRNLFMKGFVTQEILAMLAVIVSITLASTSALHLELNKIEERHGRRGFARTRAGIKQAAFFLIALLVLAVLLVVGKSALGDCLSERWASFLNGLSLFILFWNVLILVSITQAVFGISPNIPDAPEA